MRLNKIYVQDLFLSMLLSIYCFILPLAIYSLKTVFYPQEFYGVEIKILYLLAGLAYISAAYIYLAKRCYYRFLPFMFNYKTSYVLLNFFGGGLFTILFIAFYNANFPRDVYEGVGVPAAWVATGIYILFLNAISICFYFICIFLKHVFSRVWESLIQLISILGFSMCAFLCGLALYHLYGGRFYIANPEFFAAYTMFAITLKVRKTVGPIENLEVFYLLKYGG